MPKIKLGNKTVRLPRYVRVLHFYKSDPDAEAATGRTTNEFKTDLIKSGYDVYCPTCDKHFDLATFTHRIQCPACRTKWNVGLNGCPSHQ